MSDVGRAMCGAFHDPITSRQSISHDPRTVVPGQPSGAVGAGGGRKTDVKPTALKQEDLSMLVTTVHLRLVLMRHRGFSPCAHRVSHHPGCLWRRPCFDAALTQRRTIHRATQARLALARIRHTPTCKHRAQTFNLVIRESNSRRAEPWDFARCGHQYSRRKFVSETVDASFAR